MDDLTSSSPHSEKSVQRSHLNFPVVGIGASAGGMQAIGTLLEHMPANSGMAFVVVLHLSPKHDSIADEVLQRASRMPVEQVTDRVAIQPNHVYVIPPNKHLIMDDGHLQAEPQERPRGQNVAVNAFFRTLAEAHRERAIAVVLSGTGDDGAMGAARIKEQGGIVIAQTLDDAEHEGMPEAAIHSGSADFVLPVADIGQKLIDIWSNAQVMELPRPRHPDEEDLPLAAPPASLERAELALANIITTLRTSTSHDFRHYKRATVLRRIERRMQVRGMSTLPAYAALLETDANEAPALLKDMLIGVTNFFRDRDAFEALEREVIPELFRGKNPGDQIRVWVPACSTGEEAYSVAMLLNEHAMQMPKPPELQIFASDIDERSIAMARTGAYPGSILTDVPPTRMRQFFNREEDRYRIRKVVRDKVLFAAHNVLRDPPFSRLDMISCRNLLIYLNRDVQAHVLEMFHFALNPGGYLFLGSSESADAVSNFFTPIDKRHRIYRAKALSRETRFAPSIALPRTTGPGRVDQQLPSRPTRRDFSFAEIHQRILAQYAPPSVIINPDHSIVYMSDRAGRFLRHIGGEPSRNVISLVLPELRLELRTALYQAQKNNKSVEARRVELIREGQHYYVNMIVRPFHDDDAGADLVLVLFDEVEQTMEPNARATADGKDPVLRQLEEELQRTKEQLQETIEQSEVGTEELRASNEELQAINEELRSATEELETGKEELQSVNEELTTVNYELKTKVEETSKVNDDLNNLIASTDIATLFVDRAMRIKRFTPRATDIFSIIPTDIGRSLLDITRRLAYPELADDVSTTFETLQPVEREVRSGEGRFYMVRLLPYRTIEDRIDGAVMTFVEITRRRKAELELQQSDERLRMVAESTKDYAIITLDIKGVVTSWNKGAQRIFGYDEHEILGQSGDILFVPEERQQGVPKGERKRAREEGRAEDERWHLRKDGSRFFCSGVMTPLLSIGSDKLMQEHEPGTLRGYAKIARDETTRATQAQRSNPLDAAPTNGQARRTRAEMRNDMKDEFLAIMSHELRQPLNLIQINAELLARLPETSASPLGMKATRIIRSAVTTQAKIIGDLLDLARLNRGRLSLVKAPLDLAATVTSAVDGIKSDPATALQITLQIDDPAIVIQADPVRISQMLSNLLGNTLKFTPAGGRLDVHLLRENGYARLEIADTGKGIEPQLLPFVFDMFQQGDSAITRSAGGLGIGLALVRHIVELHRGRIKVESAGRDEGARFIVWLPLDQTQHDPEQEALLPTPYQMSGVRVLVVDDVADAAAGLRSLLMLEGAQVDLATSAPEGLRLLEQAPYDLLISDLAMPDMDGYAFIDAVRKQPQLAGMPAIAVTGLGRVEDARRAREAGFSTVIQKPISMQTMLAVVQSVLGSDTGEPPTQ